MLTQDEKWRLALLRGQASPDPAMMTPHPFGNEADRQAVSATIAPNFSGAGQYQPAAAGASSQTGGGFRGEMAQGTVNPYYTQEQLDASMQSLEGRENQIASQRAMAKAMRGGAPSLDGRTVGPYGVYMGPNAGEMIGNIGSKVAAGYMDYKANEADKDLDTSRLEKAAAAAAVEEGKAQQGRDREDARHAETVAFRKEQEENLQNWRAEQARLRELEINAKSEKERADAAERLAAAEKAEQKELDKYTRNYSKELIEENIPRLETSIQNFRDLLDPYMVKDAEGNPVLGEDGKPMYENIPGVGGFMNIRLGGAGTAAAQVSDFVYGRQSGQGGSGRRLRRQGQQVDMTDEQKASARDIQQAWQEIMNSKIKDDSGATVTVQENDRLSAALGKGVFDGDAAMLTGLDMLDEVIIEKRSTIDAGYSDDVRNNYQKNYDQARGLDAAPEQEAEFVLPETKPPHMSQAQWEELQALDEELNPT